MSFLFLRLGVIDFPGVRHKRNTILPRDFHSHFSGFENFAEKTAEPTGRLLPERGFKQFFDDPSASGEKISCVHLSFR